MVNFLKKVWNWLDGKKRIIGILVVFIAGGLHATHVVNDEAFKWLVELGGSIAALGVAHAFKKML